jgi:RNA polymerase sigma-70 factor (ECF subfamily)
MSGNAIETSRALLWTTDLYGTSATRDRSVSTNVTDAPAIERRLIERAQAGDVAAFERIYRLHSGRVHGVCLRMLRNNVATAEDCTQETFITAWKHLATFEARSSLATWLHRIAVNTVLARGRLKSVQNEQTVLDELPEEIDATSTAADAAETLDLERLIEDLPAGARNVLVLQGIYGYSHEEVADMLGVAVGTCKAQLHRARKLLSERLGV